MSNDKVLAGTYKGRAVLGSEQYGQNDRTGNDQIAFDIHIPDLNRTVTTFLYFSDAAAPYAIERLRACGWEGDDLSVLTGIDAKEIDVSIRYETYNGKEQMKIEIQTGGGRVKLANPMDEKAKRAFAARMKSVIQGTKAPAPTRPINSTAPALPARHDVVADDQIPF